MSRDTQDRVKFHQFVEYTTILCSTLPCVVPPREVPPGPLGKYDAITATKPGASPSLQVLNYQA